MISVQSLSPKNRQIC